MRYILSQGTFLVVISEHTQPFNEHFSKGTEFTTVDEDQEVVLLREEKPPSRVVFVSQDRFKSYFVVPKLKPAFKGAWSMYATEVDENRELFEHWRG